MEKELLLDWFLLESTPEVIEESISKNGKIILKGVVQRANAKNRNGRLYPRDILEPEVIRYMEKVKDRRAVGTIDHPNTTVPTLADASHIITALEWMGDDLVGELEVLTTPNGNVLRELLRSGVKVGISSRAVGSVSRRPDGTDEVTSDLELIAFDIVADPSTHNAFLTPQTVVEYYEHKQQSKYSGVNDIISNIFSVLSES